MSYILFFLKRSIRFISILVPFTEQSPPQTWHFNFIVIYIKMMGIQPPQSELNDRGFLQSLQDIQYYRIIASHPEKTDCSFLGSII